MTPTPASPPIEAEATLPACAAEPANGPTQGEPEAAGKPDAAGKPEAAGGSRKVKRDIARVAGIVLFFAAAGWFLNQPDVKRELFDFALLRAHLRSFGPLGIVVFVAAAAAINTLGMPRMWVTAIGGGLYGAWLGLVLAQIAVTIGASLNFWMGRLLLGSTLRRRMPARFQHLVTRFGEQGFRWVLMLRLMPVGNATFISLMAGASRVSFASFISATFLGYLPMSIISALFGSSAAKGKQGQMLVGVGLLLLMIGGQWLYKRLQACRARS